MTSETIMSKNMITFENSTNQSAHVWSDFFVANFLQGGEKIKIQPHRDFLSITYVNRVVKIAQSG